MKLRNYEKVNNRGTVIYGVTNEGEQVFETMRQSVRDKVREALQGCNCKPDFHLRLNMLHAGNCFGMSLHQDN
ncbi:MAG: hypothetical protein GQ474_08070 [Sulfurimonas sp.]|nr:hypothetical protein [Sulfurimonas sp.]